MTGQGLPTAAPVVAIEDLRITHWGAPALESVSLSVERGDVFALLGRNGAGKSSLLHCLLGVHRPAAGTVRVLGGDPWRDRVRVLARVGAVPESPNAPGDLTAPQLVSLVRRFHSRWDDRATRDRLDRFAVPPRVPFGRLSKGEQGALMLTLALGHGPELLVLDDPTLGLDVVAKEDVFAELIGELAERGTTVLLTTHEIGLAEGLATHVAILANRRIAVAGELESLKAQHGASLDTIYRSCVVREGRAA
jgi:ABC-2 type transport system ATP-binding protein